MSKKRKIAFIITSKIHYARSKLILDEIKKNDALDLSIIVGASAILPNYGDVLTLIEKDGFTCSAKITMTLEGGSAVAMAKTTGIGIAEFATAFDNIKPDVVVVRGDRYEVLSAAVSAAYLNIPVAHIEGGDVTGTIDESVRHAISKLAHIHFPTNNVSKDRLIRMGEQPEYVFNVGCPGIEFIAKETKDVSRELINTTGVGSEIDLTQPYLMVVQHPVTSEIGDNRFNTEQTLDAVSKSNTPAIWFWPNVDAGTDEVSKALRVFREEQDTHQIRFIKHIEPGHFAYLLKNAACLVGNSSAGIKEASYFGTPVVNIGTRQSGRMRGEHIIDAEYDATRIQDAIETQLRRGCYAQSDMYYKPGTSSQIAHLLATLPLYTQKRFCD